MSEQISSETQFWLIWAAHAATAVGTIGAVVVALFGGWLRAHLAAPKLSIHVENARGVLTGAGVADPATGKDIHTSERWYHVRVENLRRWAPATEVQLFLSRIEERNAAGQYQPTWVGDLPIPWRHQNMKPLRPTIGHSDDCDLCSVLRMPTGGHVLKLHPLIRDSLTPTRWQGITNIAVVFRAYSLDNRSNLLRVEIAWNGQWAEDEVQMARYLVITADTISEA